MNLILAQTLKQIHKILGDEAARLSVERVVVGLFFTGVKLSNGVCGIITLRSNPYRKPSVAPLKLPLCRIRAVWSVRG